MTYDDLTPTQKSALRQRFLLEELSKRKTLDSTMKASLNGLKVTLAGISSDILPEEEARQIFVQVSKMVLPVKRNSK